MYIFFYENILKDIASLGVFIQAVAIFICCLFYVEKLYKRGFFPTTISQKLFNACKSKKFYFRGIMSTTQIGFNEFVIHKIYGKLLYTYI